jgi:putative aminopeptidase FrvX
MDGKAFAKLAARLLRHPAVPYHEQSVREEVEQICAAHGLKCRRDPYGNLLVRLRTASNRRPIVLAAHLDHPGFELVRALGGRRWLARFRGGVPATYFRPGLPLRLMPGAVPAKIEGIRNLKKLLFDVRAIQTPTQPPRFAVWELTDFDVRRGRIHARACDDLIGAAAVLGTLIELRRSGAKVDVIGVFSRAEEVGFHGALALAAGRGLPAGSLVVSLETSKELPGVKMGRGVILRVGDRASVFDSAATRFLGEVAAELQQSRRGFTFQRALMGGGTCEATAYQEFGYQSAAVCVALGNYHNCGANGTINAEFVSLEDACQMVNLLVQAAKRMSQFGRLTRKLPHRLRGLLRVARAELPQ